MIIKYIISGVFTTLVNVLLFKLLNLVCSTVIATFLSWFFCVLLSYVIYELYVFKTKSSLVKFYISRLATCLLDIIIMSVSVDILSFDADIMKFLSNILVAVINFILSKILFTKKGSVYIE